MKVPFVDYKLLTIISKAKPLQINDYTNQITAESVLLTASRACVIVKPFVGKTISVFNGKRSKRLLIKSKMIGYNLGQFIFTKKMGQSIHNSNRNRKKKEKMRRKITDKKVRKPKEKATKNKIKSKYKKK